MLTGYMENVVRHFPDCYIMQLLWLHPEALPDSIPCLLYTSTSYGDQDALVAGKVVNIDSEKEVMNVEIFPNPRWPALGV